MVAAPTSARSFQVSKYISLVGLMVAAFGIGFEFPVLLVFLQLVGVLNPQTLSQEWRYAIMVIFVVAAVITPSGDPISMLALAVPMTIFYVISIVIGCVVPAPAPPGRRRRGLSRRAGRARRRTGRMPPCAPTGPS